MADAIVSLEWLAKYTIDIRSKEHGVMIKSTAKQILAKGLKSRSDTTCSSANQVTTQPLEAQEDVKPKVL